MRLKQTNKYLSIEFYDDVRGIARVLELVEELRDFMEREDG